MELSGQEWVTTPTFITNCNDVVTPNIKHICTSTLTQCGEAVFLCTQRIPEFVYWILLPHLTINCYNFSVCSNLFNRPVQVPICFMQSCSSSLVTASRTSYSWHTSTILTSIVCGLKHWTLFTLLNSVLVVLRFLFCNKSTNYADCKVSIIVWCQLLLNVFRVIHPLEVVFTTVFQ